MNDKKFKLATKVGKGIIIVDDPHDEISDEEKQKVNEWWDEVMKTKLPSNVNITNVLSKINEGDKIKMLNKEIEICDKLNNKLYELLGGDSPTIYLTYGDIVEIALGPVGIWRDDEWDQEEDTLEESITNALRKYINMIKEINL